jgi:hypothetical protein
MVLYDVLVRFVEPGLTVLAALAGRR